MTGSWYNAPPDAVDSTRSRRGPVGTRQCPQACTETRRGGTTQLRALRAARTPYVRGIGCRRRPLRRCCSAHAQATRTARSRTAQRAAASPQTPYGAVPSSRPRCAPQAAYRRCGHGDTARPTDSLSQPHTCEPRRWHTGSARALRTPRLRRALRRRVQAVALYYFAEIRSGATQTRCRRTWPGAASRATERDRRGGLQQARAQTPGGSQCWPRVEEPAHSRGSGRRLLRQARGCTRVSQGGRPSPHAQAPSSRRRREGFLRCCMCACRRQIV